MFGIGILKGLWVTLTHFIDSYVDDIQWLGRRYFKPEGIAHRASKDTKGIFTVQYPEERVPVPEEFRYVPFLVYDDKPDGGKEIRCTSCGICAKVCPPQCIWIVRTNDPQTGRPVPEPAEFYIDADICMNCGFCAEYCPFDAIIMDHDYEIASYDRNVFNMDQLLKPASYYQQIRPINYQRNMDERKAKEAAKAAKASAAASSAG